MAIKAGQAAVYGLRCPISGAVRYVGKSADPQRRLRQHVVEVGTHPQLRKSQWIAGLISVGLRPKMEVLEWVPVAEAIAAERRWIAQFPDLCNHLEKSPEHVRKVAEALRGRVVGPPTEETRARISAAMKGHGKSEVTKRAMAKAKQGERHPRASVTEAVVREIREAAASGEARKAIAERYGVKYSLVTDIVLKRRWAHI